MLSSIIKLQPVGLSTFRSNLAKYFLSKTSRRGCSTHRKYLKKILDVMHVRILPILPYGAQTWFLSKRQKFTIGMRQRDMEMQYLGSKIVRPRTEQYTALQNTNRWCCSERRQPEMELGRTRNVHHELDLIQRNPDIWDRGL